MRKTPLVCFIAITVFMCGCSEGEKTVAEVIKGIARKDQEQIPEIVKEQRRREKIRQNTMWTEENQALHPLEYCQAQLSAITKYEEDLSVLQFSIRKLMARNENQQRQDQIDVVRYAESFRKMKALYLETEKANAWPAEYNGVLMSRDKLQDAIIDLDAEIKRINEGLGGVKQRNVILEKKMARVQTEQKALVDLKRKISDTILSLKEKKVVGETASIKEALMAINASICAINAGSGVIIDDVVDEKPDEVRKRKFRDIISKE